MKEDVTKLETQLSRAHCHEKGKCWVWSGWGLCHRAKWLDEEEAKSNKGMIMALWKRECVS